MKLKKIASLALAGVMAVSMLAGCSNGNGGDDNTVVVPTGIVANVIADLDKDVTDKVAFSADASLQTSLEKAVEMIGSEVSSYSDTALITALNKIDKNLNATDEGVIPAKDTANSVTNDDDTQKVTKISMSTQTMGASEAYAAQQIASAMESKKISGESANQTFVGLPEKGAIHQDSDGNNYWYNFDYTCGVAGVTVTDTVTGQTIYVVAYTVTRTPAKAEQ